MKRTSEGNHIAIVIPYFGKIPDYLGTYLASLVDKHVDVLWISDLPVPRHPENFKSIPMTFDECKARIASRLGVPVRIDVAYRLCDFKPMYGQVFEDLLADYDYWGFGDCDLVYGEPFNDFLDKVVLSGDYDVISLDPAYLSGPTCFFRNDARMRTFYRKTRNWKEVCAAASLQAFDECGGEFHFQLMGGTMTMEDCSRIRDSFSAAVWRDPDLRFYHKEVIDERSLWRFGDVVVNGTQVLRNGEPVTVYHFISAKGACFFRTLNVPFERVRSYRITPTGFYHGDWMWRTRFPRKICRYAVGFLGYVRTYGMRRFVTRAFETLIAYAKECRSSHGMP